MREDHKEEFKKFLATEMDNNLVPALSDYIRIKSSSSAFDPEWKTNGIQ